MLQGAEKNYNTHNKELLAIFEAFKSWQHFLEGSAEVIDMVTDHKNLEYFTSSKKLLHCQARWAKFLMQFNMKVQFRPGRLGLKLDMLIHRWDIYMRGDDWEPTSTNVHLVFNSEQLTESLVMACARSLEDPTPSNTLDHDALSVSIATACAEDDLAVMVRLVCTPPTISDHLRLLRTHLRLVRMPPIISASIPLHPDVIPTRTA